jgi:hypothetical protein
MDGGDSRRNPRQVFRIRHDAVIVYIQGYSS